MNKINYDDLLFTVPEASKILKVEQKTVRNLIAKGFLQALKLGRVKIRKVEIERFLQWSQGKDLTDLNNVKELN
ncbi:helix-turn-helix domain-containing protein [Clostridium guangxiense]|uniref:helix-turn-helix domain-containing protein n=1 Tax=Clostridium guangxiense TaxID=1662055 RepID=UPI001E2E236F|nr:helix-turn-helix domain-containing protein [Clostridium guangxiense]MCD2345770.1 helix-turn-helix domain-containing protein [Clostridium guangxiense]